MSYRDKPKTQLESHHRVLSYDITKHIRHYQNHQNESQSSSINFPTNNNFNSGEPILLSHQLSNNTSQSQVDSDNQTQNFIRAEFNKYQVKPTHQNFKLFKENLSKQTTNNKPKHNIHNQDTNKQPNYKNPIYHTTFFEIQISDNQPNTRPQQKEPHKTSTRKSLTKDQINALESSGYSQIQQLEKAIMRTLRQKQKQISFLQKQLANLNEQKLLSFSINRQLQTELFQVKKKSSHIEKIRQSSVNGQLNWKPENVEQMKLLIENQRLTDQLAQLEQQQLKFKSLHEQITDQQMILRESLEKAFKTRKDYIKAITAVNQEDQTPTHKKYIKAQNTQLSRQTLLKPKQTKQARIYSTQTITKLTRTKQKSTKNRYKTPHNCNHASQSLKKSKQLSEMKEKQLLLKLLQDFNELKNKVDQSLILKSKNDYKTKSLKQTDLKPRRKVVYNNI